MPRTGTTPPTDRDAPRPTRTSRSFQPEAIDRWQPNPGEKADRQHIVRVVASHPHYLGWLQDRLGATLDREAQRLLEGGHQAAAAVLHERARAYRRGELDAL